MKKILLGLGTIAMIGSPIIAVVSCSDDPVVTDFSYTYDGEPYASLEAFGHDVFADNKEAVGKEIGIVNNGTTYKKELTADEVKNFKKMLDDGDDNKNAYNVMIEIAHLVKLPENLMSAYEAALKATFPPSHDEGGTPGPGPGPTENSYTFVYGDNVSTTDIYEFFHKVFRAASETPPNTFPPGKSIEIINGTRKYAKIVDIDEAKIFTDMIKESGGNAYNISLELASFVGLPDADVKDYSTQVSNAIEKSSAPEWHQGQITDFEFTYDGTTYTDDEDWYVNETGSSLYKFGQHAVGAGKRLEANKDIKIDHTKAGGTEYSTTLTAENITELDSILGIDPNPKDTFHYMEKLAEILQMTGSIQKTFHTYLRTFFAAP